MSEPEPSEARVSPAILSNFLVGAMTVALFQAPLRERGWWHFAVLPKVNHNTHYTAISTNGHGDMFFCLANFLL